MKLLVSILIITGLCLAKYNTFSDTLNTQNNDLLPDALKGRKVYAYKHPYVSLDLGVYNLEQYRYVSNRTASNLLIIQNKLFISVSEGTYSDGIKTIDISTDEELGHHFIVKPNFIYYSEHKQTFFAGHKYGLVSSQDGVSWNTEESLDSLTIISMIETDSLLTVSGYANTQETDYGLYKYDSGNKTLEKILNNKIFYNLKKDKNGIFYARNNNPDSIDNNIYISHTGETDWAAKVICENQADILDFAINDNSGNEYIAAAFSGGIVNLSYYNKDNFSLISNRYDDIFENINKLENNNNKIYACTNSGLYELPEIKNKVKFNGLQGGDIRFYRLKLEKYEGEATDSVSETPVHTENLIIREETELQDSTGSTISFVIKSDSCFLFPEYRVESVDLYNNNLYGTWSDEKVLIDSLSAEKGDIYKSILFKTPDNQPQEVIYYDDYVHNESAYGNLHTKIIKPVYDKWNQKYFLNDKLGVIKHNSSIVTFSDNTTRESRYTRELIFLKRDNNIILGSKSFIYEDINYDAIWTDSVIIVDEITVNSPLNISPGTLVYFAGENSRLIINNSFSATGAPEDPVIFENFYEGQKWGGIEVIGGDSVIFNNCIFRNIRNNKGGAIQGSNGIQIEISDCVEEGCVGEDGPMYFKECSAEIFGLLVNNSGSNTSGGGIKIENSKVNIINSTLADNSSQVKGAGIIISDSDVNISNSIIWNNTSPDESQITINGSNPVSITNSIIQGGKNGIDTNDKSYSNVVLSRISDKDPDFTNFANTGSKYKSFINNYCVKPASPCIDEGYIDNRWNIPEHDFAGNKRIIGNRIDIGAYEYDPVETEENKTPERIVLSQNYPNPFNPVTTIQYSVRALLVTPAPVNLSVYNSNGQLVKTLVKKKQKPGSYSVKFDGSALNSGMYFYRLNTQGKAITKKMILIK